MSKSLTVKVISSDWKLLTQVTLKFEKCIIKQKSCKYFSADFEQNFKIRARKVSQELAKIPKN
jgi:hypothetical protein